MTRYKTVVYRVPSGIGKIISKYVKTIDWQRENLVIDFSYFK